VETIHSVLQPTPQPWYRRFLLNSKKPKQVEIPKLQPTVVLLRHEFKEAIELRKHLLIHTDPIVGGKTNDS
jgi:hypothetical protein